MVKSIPADTGGTGNWYYPEMARKPQGRPARAAIRLDPVKRAGMTTMVAELLSVQVVEKADAPMEEWDPHGKRFRILPSIYTGLAQLAYKATIRRNERILAARKAAREGVPDVDEIEEDAKAEEEEAAPLDPELAKMQLAPFLRL
jgi:hypothetical protein